MIPLTFPLPGAVAPAAKSYYISAAGNNGNSGLDTSHPWLDLTNLNNLRLNPGDTVNFRGGDTFTLAGSITFNYSGGLVNLTGSGKNGKPITFQSYGAGQATLSITGDNVGFHIGPTSFLTINNLVLQGDNVQRVSGGAPETTTHGIYLRNAGNAQTYGLTISGCLINNFINGNGINFDEGAPTNQAVIIQSLFITGCEITGCVNGIVFFTGNGRSSISDPIKAISSTTITDNNVHDNPGRSDHGGLESGWGMYLQGMQGLTVSSNTVNHNGVNGTSGGSAGSGITLFTCDSVVVKNNEVKSQSNAGSGQDGSGIEVNTGCSNVVCEWNYVHDCDGMGIQVAQSPSDISPAVAFTSNVIVRYNIIAKNVVGDNGSYIYSAITLWGAVNAVHVYGNTVYQPTTSISGNYAGNAAVYLAPDARSSSGPISDVHFRGNVFSVGAASGAALAFQADQPLSSATYFTNVTWDKNWWYSSAGGVNFIEGQTPSPTVYASLAAWGRDSGTGTTDPKLKTPTDTSSANNFKLAVGSPCLSTGPNVFGSPYSETWDPWGLASGPFALAVGSQQDYFGNAVPGASPNYGAYNGAGV